MDEKTLSQKEQKKEQNFVLRRVSVQEQLSRTRWGPTFRKSEDRVQRLFSVQEEHKGGCGATRAGGGG